MTVKTEKWGNHAYHLDPRYQQRARHRRKKKRTLQARGDQGPFKYEEEGIICEQPPRGMKQRVFQYIFGDTWSSKT